MAKKTIVVAKTADQARAQAAAASAARATAAQAAAKKAAAAQAAAAKAAAAKKAAADKAAAAAAKKKKDDAYIANLKKATSPTSSGMYTYGERPNMSGGTTPYNPEQAATGLTAKPPVEKKVEEEPPIEPDPIVDPIDTAAANDRADAFALIKITLQGYGFNDDELNQLFAYIEKGLKDPKMGPNQMVLELRTLPVYKARFAGNETRVKNGINALSEAQYVQQENSYAEYLKAGGVSRLGNRATYAKLIGGAVAPNEVGKRVNMAVDRVVNSDAGIMKMIYKYNPQISQQDLVAYFLDPDATLPELEKKVSMGEIGAAASQAGMDYGFGRIEDLQKYGVDRAQAIAGYGNIGQVLPVAGKLGDIYGESGVKYDQTTGESEFFKSDATAMEKRRRLKSMERAQFQGDSGVSSQMGSLDRNTQGAF